MSEVAIRDTVEADLPILFEHQMDPVAVQMAAFPSRELDAVLVHWRKILASENVAKTILFDGKVAGNLVCWEQSGERLVGYWIGQEYWGRGIASRALAEFLRLETARPLHAHVAKHNLGSIRVLEKCGFARTGESPAPPGGEEVEEWIFTLGE
jgi:RimJ/RimL family protein N-acetyltransferase